MPSDPEPPPQLPYRIFRMARFGRPVLATPAGPLPLRLAGLVRFQPFTARRAMYRRIMRWLMHHGLDHWFAQDAMSPIDASAGLDFSAWLEAARADVSDPRAVASVIWPTDPRRKRLYVHLFDTSARPVGFAKVSLNEDNDRRLERESRVLATLGAMNLRYSRVPRVLADRVFAGHRYLILEPVPESAVPLPAEVEGFPREAAEEFAGPARFVPFDRVTALSWWPAYERRLTPQCAGFDEELRRLASRGIHVRRAHGDFGRNNIVSVAGLPWIFDWEESHDDAPARTDEVVFWLTSNYRHIIARPRAAMRDFAARFLRLASEEERRDVMLVLAFRLSLGMPTAAKLIPFWNSVREARP